jgi:hypothetical protein
MISELKALAIAGDPASPAARLARGWVAQTRTFTKGDRSGDKAAEHGQGCLRRSHHGAANALFEE